MNKKQNNNKLIPYQGIISTVKSCHWSVVATHLLQVLRSLKVHFLQPFVDSFKEIQIRPETVQVHTPFTKHIIPMMSRNTIAKLFLLILFWNFSSSTAGASSCHHQRWDREHLQGDHNHHHNQVRLLFIFAFDEFVNVSENLTLLYS